MAIDQYHLLDDATAMIDEVYDLSPVVQMARFGRTAQHITRQEVWKGGAMHFKVINQIFSRTLIDDDLESDAPGAGKISTLDVKIEESNLRKLQFSLRYTIPMEYEVDGGEHAAWDLAKELVLQSEDSLGEKRNQVIHQNSRTTKAIVNGKYNTDGATYNGSTPATVFIQIDQGSISSFHKGEMITIKVGATYVARAHCIVDDVWHDEYYGTGAAPTAIGPGLVVTYDTRGDNSSWADAAGDQHLHSVADGDEIIATGEVDSSGTGGMGLELGFDTLFSRWSGSAMPYFNIADRRAKGYTFLIPYGRDWGDVPLEVDQHFGVMADTMPMVYGPGRARRQGKKFTMTDAIVAVCQPDLLNETARQVGDSSVRFTKKLASDMTAAQRSTLVAVQGWDGVVLRHPTLPPIALQQDELCKAGTITIFEPSIFMYVRMGSKRPRFIKQSTGSMWHNRRSTSGNSNGNLTMHMDASGFVIETLVCDQPQLGYRIDGVQSSL